MTKFQRYKRGSLVMVDFSPSIGSELQNKHLAIVLTKNDSPNNGVLTVVPLSSKNKPYYLNLGSFLWNMIIPKINVHATQIKEDFIRMKNELSEYNKSKPEKSFEDKEKEEKRLLDHYNALTQNINEYQKIIAVYKKMNVDSFALVQNITTISKLRVKKPLNKYDPILKLQVPSNILDDIDKKILELFTNTI